MDEKSYCLEWHLQTFKRYYSEETLIFKDFRILIQYFYFVIFNWEFFPVDWENNRLFKKKKNFNWEYNPKMAIK
jgi:hypothetical protein